MNRTYTVSYIYDGKKLSEVVVQGYEFKFSKKVKSKRGADAFVKKTIQMIEDYVEDNRNHMFGEFEPR